jgi:hypothetical protein
MANVCELLINVVKENRPKMLTGLSQTATQWVKGLHFPPSWASIAAGGEREPKPDIVEHAELPLAQSSLIARREREP